MNKIFKINKKDNVAVALCDLKKGANISGLEIKSDIPFGHKVALCDLKNGDNIIKYSFDIGHAVKCIKKGEHVHSHNMATNLSLITDYKFNGKQNNYLPKITNITFNGYRRKNKKAATRNDIWIIPTVGCVNKTAERLAEIGNKIVGNKCSGVFAYTHPYGCSQLGDDQENTQKILASLVNHPNAGGVLVVSLGCENNNLEVFKKFLGEIDDKRVKFIVTQDSENELLDGTNLIKEIYDEIKNYEREPIPIDELVIGYKCGGSDAFSGITANQLCGRLTDKLTCFGASAILTEVPEMFGAERVLMERAENEQVFNSIVEMVNGFKDYYVRHNQEIYENPSPGNKAGGITTLEEKSLGCIQKGGKAIITDVLKYGEQCSKSGLNLLTGPGNDIVSTTNITAAGALVILFSTGRGTPLGAPVPTIKISSNSVLAKKKSNWIDYDAGNLIENNDFEKETNNLFKLLLSVASGEKTKNEVNGYREIAIFKEGVTL